MTRVAACAVTIVLLAFAAQAWAQSWEVSGFAANTPSAGLDNQAQELSGLDISGGFTWGVQGARWVTPNWGVDALWTQQRSALRLETGDGSADLFTMSVGQLHGNLVRQFGAANARLRPFVFAGLGATFFSADDLRFRDEAVARARRRREVLSLERDWHPRTRSLQADDDE